jgi:homoserine dehydrogenase
MKEVGLGLLGFGTVGAGVVRGLQTNTELIGNRVGILPVLKWIADVDLDRDRGVSVPTAILTRDAWSVIKDPAIQVVIELIGGTRVARDLVKGALELGKPVVTANKALLAQYGAEIFALARKRNVDVYFGASVGGGIPVIRALRDGLVGNRIERIRGILNGTCNYILTRMEREQMPFEGALKEAQNGGYAEQDPSLDIDGIDTSHKAVLLASLAYGFHVPLAAVHTEGIRRLSDLDIRCARELGYRIKLLAVIKRVGTEIEVRVHPTLIPLDHMLASVDGVFNAILVQGDLTGETLYYGRGAGQSPTASTVIADVVDALQNLDASSAQRAPAMPNYSGQARVRAMRDVKTRCYLRLSLLDQAGVLARIAALLGEQDISIASVLQKEVHSGEYVPVVMVTHAAEEYRFETALKQIEALDVVGAPTLRIRIED